MDAASAIIFIPLIGLMVDSIATEFYDSIVEFFQALQTSAVEPVVVIAYPKEKSDTVHKRNDAKGARPNYYWKN